MGAIEKKVIDFYKEYLQSDPEYKTKTEDDLEDVTGDEVT
jgi:hypothetical protein